MEWLSSEGGVTRLQRKSDTSFDQRGSSDDQVRNKFVELLLEQDEGFRELA